MVSNRLRRVLLSDVGEEAVWLKSNSDRIYCCVDLLIIFALLRPVLAWHFSCIDNYGSPSATIRCSRCRGSLSVMRGHVAQEILHDAAPTSGEWRRYVPVEDIVPRISKVLGTRMQSPHY